MLVIIVGYTTLFSLVRKKVPKKYAEGLQALMTPIGRERNVLFSAVRKKYQKSTPEDFALWTPCAVKFLRFDGDT